MRGSATTAAFSGLSVPASQERGIWAPGADCFFGTSTLGVLANNPRQILKVLASLQTFVIFLFHTDPHVKTLPQTRSEPATSQSHQTGTQYNKCDVSGLFKCEVRLKLQFHHTLQRSAMPKKKDARDGLRFGTRSGLVFVIIYAGLTAYQDYLTRASMIDGREHFEGLGTYIWVKPQDSGI